MLISKEGHAKLVSQVEALRESVRRAVETTSDMYNNAGDNWHDNPAWSDATQKQDMIQGQLMRLENALKEQIVYIEDQPYPADEITPGKTVRLLDLDDGSEEEITILGPLEGDPSGGVVSNLSPIAQALIGLKQGSIVPFRGIEFKVLSIRAFHD